MRTIENWLRGIGRKHQKHLDCPIWPPDLYAICAALLRISGAYIEIFAERSRSPAGFGLAHRNGRLWRKNIDAIKGVNPVRLRSAVPPAIRESWDTVLAQKDLTVGTIRLNRTIARHLINMVLASDEACAGIGIDTDPLPFLATAQEILTSNDLQTFAWDIPLDAVGVLPKQHTPQLGATLRSLTHHLGLYLPNDIEARWIGPYVSIGEDEKNESVNILLVPWPFVVESEDFQLVRMPNSKGTYFEYNPAQRGRRGGVRTWLKRALKDARKHARRVDVVVFPELALSISEYSEIERVCVDAGAMLIAGIRFPTGRASRGANFCALQPAGLFLRENHIVRKQSGTSRKVLVDSHRLVQSKHHRWCLDRQQLLQYQLAGRIPPTEAPIWENIVIPPRLLHFVTLGKWMTWSVLICEDLARQDPAADLIRSVGPNLLIALLMDGPQLRGRWSSRYASVFAEDPGTSVLTLTSLGMAERCRPTLLSTGRRADKSRAVALWKDVETGEHEIVLDEADNACILTVVPLEREEYAADGRRDGAKTCYPVFAGYKSFQVAT